MRHRHLVDGAHPSVATVHDILERGSVDDWRALAAEIRQQPWGPAARALEAVLEGFPMYGTTVIWRRFLARVRDTDAADRRAPGAAP